MKGNPPAPWVIVGRIGKAHGLDGSVRVWPEADLGEIFENQVPLRLWFPPKAPGSEMIPETGHEAGEAWVIRWEGYSSRESTAALRNGWLVAQREDLPEPAEDCVYWNDLLDSEVRSKQDDILGRIIDIIDSPAQTLVEVRKENGNQFLIPLSEQIDADFELSDDEEIPNILRVDLPDGLEEATTSELQIRPRKRDRRPKK